MAQRTESSKTMNNNKDMEDNKKTWSGRFNNHYPPWWNLSASVNFDQRLAEYDIKDRWRTQMLRTRNYQYRRFQRHTTRLATILEEIRNQQFSWLLEQEDVHLNMKND